MSSASSLNRDPSLLDESTSPQKENPSLLDRAIPPMIRRA